MGREPSVRVQEDAHGVACSISDDDVLAAIAVHISDTGTEGLVSNRIVCARLKHARSFIQQYGDARTSEVRCGHVQLPVSVKVRDGDEVWARSCAKGLPLLESPIAFAE